MNHSFNPSQVHTDKCSICKWPEIQHTSDAICDACPNIGPVTPSPDNKMLLCKDCWNKEAIIPINSVLKTVRDIDTSVQLRTDLFNAATVAITEIQLAIESDESITNKPYELASRLKDRFMHFKQVIFDANQEIIEASNNQKAIQIHLNQLANQLRAEEREKLQLQNINYKPAQVKPAKSGVGRVKSKKLDKVELRKIAAEFNIPEFLLQQTVIQKNVDIRGAAQIILKQVEAMKTGTN